VPDSSGGMLVATRQANGRQGRWAGVAPYPGHTCSRRAARPEVRARARPLAEQETSAPTPAKRGSVASQGRGGRRYEGARAVRQAGGARGQAGMANKEANREPT
jgi:hypothetical protein